MNTYASSGYQNQQVADRAVGREQLNRNLKVGQHRFGIHLLKEIQSQDEKSSLIDINGIIRFPPFANLPPERYFAQRVIPRPKVFLNACDCIRHGV
jgi:hypothetical protein